MRPVGFSTGALAQGDFRRALELLESAPHATAVELSALREGELSPFVQASPSLDLDRFPYVSVHVPSRLESMEEREVVLILDTFPEDWVLVVHPNVITTPVEWRRLGRRLCIENMDDRKPLGRSVEELQPFFAELPEASFCLDVGHARQIDPTLSNAILMLRAFGDRLAQLHVSDVGPKGEHRPLGASARLSFSRLAHLVPMDCPLIIESVVSPEAIAAELDVVSGCFSQPAMGASR